MQGTQAYVHIVAQKNNPRYKDTQTPAHTGVSNTYNLPSSFTCLGNSGLWCVLVIEPLLESGCVMGTPVTGQGQRHSGTCSPSKYEY